MTAPSILGLPPFCLLRNMLDLKTLISFGEKLRTDILKETDGGVSDSSHASHDNCADCLCKMRV